MNFEQEVLNRSQSIPIVVDFWAPWCGPCRYLGPNLDKLAKQQEGLWELVKINVDEHPELSSQYGIMSIPAVKMFHNGGIVAEFTGALPISAIEQWLVDYLPSDVKEEINTLLSNEGIIPDLSFTESLQPVVDKHPEYKNARVALARHLVFFSPGEAVKYVEDIHMGDEFFDTASGVRQLAHFLDLDLDEDSPIANVLLQSQQALNEGKLEEAIKNLIEANRLDKNYQKDLPRLTAISFFEILGSKHELTKKYRRVFDMVLY